MPSPRPTPSAINKLRGNPGKRGRNKQEPKPGLGIATRPAWLCLEAKLEWNRIVPELELVGVLTKVDRAILSMYCQLWGKQVERAKDGKAPSVPELAQLRLYAIELGLTPSARVKLAVERPAPPDPGGVDYFGELLAGGKN